MSKERMYKCDSKCVTERRKHYRDITKMSRNLLTLIGLEQVTLQLQGSKAVGKFNVAVKGLSKHAKDWKPKEKCTWCKGSRVGVSGEQINVSLDIDPAPEPPKRPSKRKAETNHFAFDNIPKFPVVSDPLTVAANNFAALFNPLLMPNGMFPPWPMPQPFNNHHSLPFDRMYPPLPPLPSQQHQRPQFDVDSMQRYMSDWQAQLLNMNMMSYFLRAPNLLSQFPVPPPSMLTAQQQLFQQFQNQQNPQLRPFILKDPPKKANRATPIKSSKLLESDEMPLDLSSKNGTTKRVKNEEDDQGSTTASVDLNDKSSSPELNETGNRLTKRNYTQQALNEAVTEILSGRLGTRRASVVYGIPRSTLRNKIYKLESTDETNGDAKRKRLRKADDSFMDTKAHSLDKADEDPITEPLHKTQSMPSMDSPTTFPFGHTSNLLSQLPPINPFTDLFKHYVDKQMENNAANSKEASASPPTENSSDEMEKRPRPKRGQYRKYDKGALEKAVLSVRKGEMSVHRAGSFYGVPHSTLEYKVKERNLLRSKRRYNGDKKSSPGIIDDDKPILQKNLSCDNVDSSASSTSENPELNTLSMMQ